MDIISVIIPVFNKSDLLDDTIKSVVMQSWSNFEILCVDDGSTDDSLIKLEKWAKEDHRIHVVKRENGGLSAARNSGLEVAKGKWVVFLDAGDVLHKDALKILCQAALEHGVEVALSKCFVKAKTAEMALQKLHSCQNSSMRVFDFPLQDLLAFKYARSSVCNKMYLRSKIAQFSFQEGVLFEDWPFLTKLFGKIEKFVLVEQPLYGYVTTSGSITRSTFSKEKIQGYVSGIENVNEYYRQDGSVPRAALKRCAIAAKMMLSKVWHLRAQEPLLRQIAVQEFMRLIRERKILLRDVACKALVRVFAMHYPITSIWIVATLFWIVSTAIFTQLYPVWMPDVVVRYAPMAEAFAAGDWQMAFHPRFACLFQVLTGIVCKITPFNGLQACQCVAAAFWVYSIIPLWVIAKRVFNVKTAFLCAAFLLIAPRPFGLALDGLRDDGRLLAMLLAALAFIDAKSFLMSIAVFILVTLRVDCYFIGSVLLAIWCGRGIWLGQYKSLLLPIVAWVCGTAAVVTMIHYYTGHWVVAVQLIKYVGGWL